MGSVRCHDGCAALWKDSSIRQLLNKAECRNAMYIPKVSMGSILRVYRLQPDTTAQRHTYLLELDELPEIQESNVLGYQGERDSRAFDHFLVQTSIDLDGAVVWVGSEIRDDEAAPSMTCCPLLGSCRLRSRQHHLCRQLHFAGVPRGLSCAAKVARSADRRFRRHALLASPQEKGDWASRGHWAERLNLPVARWWPQHLSTVSRG